MSKTAKDYNLWQLPRELWRKEVPSVSLTAEELEEMARELESVDTNERARPYIAKKEGY